MVFDLSRRGFGKVPVLERKEIPAFEAAWARLQTDEPGWPTKKDKPLHDALLAWLRFHEAMLVGELVPLALTFLRNNPVNDFTGRYNWVVVDEYQDLNRAEQALIQQLAQKAVLLVAGDDDQSIYAFKYAHPEGIKTFNADADYPLPVCYRCPSLVLTLARSLIESAGAARLAKELRPRPGAPEGEVSVLQWRDVVVESRGLASIIATWVKAGRFAPGEVLILSPRRVFAEFIREALSEAGLESRLYYSEQVFDSQRASEGFALLCLLADPGDRVALRMWLGLGSQEWRAKEYNRLRGYCEKEGITPWTALEKLAVGEVKIPYTKGIVDQFKKLEPRLAESAKADLKTVVDKAFPADDEDVAELRDIAVAAVEGAEHLMALLRRMRERIAQPDVPTKRTTISIMAPYRAKGLEADLVVVSSCVEGFVPMIDHDAPTEEQARQVAEGRRLFYVGITRARQGLIISSFRAIPAGPAKRIGFGATKGASGMLKQPASRYLGELGPSCPVTVEGDHFIAGLAAAGQ